MRVLRRSWLLLLILLLWLVLPFAASAWYTQLGLSIDFYVFVLSADLLGNYDQWSGYQTQHRTHPALLPSMAAYGAMTGVLAGLLARGLVQFFTEQHKLIAWLVFGMEALNF